MSSKDCVIIIDVAAVQIAGCLLYSERWPRMQWAKCPYTDSQPMQCLLPDSFISSSLPWVIIIHWPCTRN